MSCIIFDYCIYYKYQKLTRGDFMPFQIVRNDITKMKVDAVINTANPNAAYGRGLMDFLKRLDCRRRLKY